MKLLSLETASFGTLKISEPLMFAPGLNIVIAPNQAGKSTLLTLIEWSLFGVPPHSNVKRSTVSLDEWAPWSGEKPGAVLTLMPEQAGWPSQVRLDARLAEYAPYLSDSDTLADVSNLMQVFRNGTWDLGQKLLGLRREAFRASLLAMQTELEQVLTDVEMRKLLTTDLADLVEDPERATLDAAFEALEKPVFACEPLAPTPVLLNSILNRAEDDLKRRRHERLELEAKYSALEQALSERESAESQVSKIRGEVDELEKRRDLFDLAAANWRYSQVFKLKEVLREWDRRIAEAPFLADFPFEIENALQRWRGELSQHRDNANRQRAKLDQHRSRLSATEEQIKRDEQLLALADSQQQLGELATAIDLGQKEISTADWKVREYGEGSDASTRSRFEALDERIAPQREAVPAVIEWIETQARLTAEQEKLAARITALTPLANSGTPVLLYIAALMFIGAVASGIFGVLNHAAVAGIALAAVLIVAAFWLFSTGLKRRRSADSAALEINEVIKPGLDKLNAQLKSHAYLHVELQARFGLSDELWQQLLKDLPEYGQLNLRLRNYADAIRDRDNGRAKIDKAWATVRYFLADAPVAVDHAWLTARIAKIDEARKRQQERIDMLAAIKDGDRELANLERREKDDFLPRLARMLEPLGLGSRALADSDSAIRQFETFAREARQYKDQLALLTTAEERARDIPMPLEQYEQRINSLPSQQIQETARLIQDEDGYKRITTERKAVNIKVVELRQKLDQAQATAGRYREHIARDEEALLGLPEAQAQEAAALERLETIRRWQRAIDLLRRALGDLQRELVSSLAPRISEELQYILRQAPVQHVEAAALGEQLELRLRLHGAPPGLAPAELIARLSVGAKRQLALAVRAAVARALGATHSAPLLLDEPLAELDDERAAGCLSYLAQLAREQQVLLTTCHKTQYDWLLQHTGVKAQVLALP